MKILFVVTSLYTGGTEKLVIEMVPRLIALGHDVDVALFDGTETPFKKILKKTSCKIYDLGRNMKSPLVIFKLVKLMRKYDIIHTHNTYPQIYAAIANLYARKAIVTTEHSTNNRRREIHLLSVVDKWMYRQYAKVICISKQAEVNLVEYLGGNKGNILTIFNGVDVGKYHSAQPNPDMRKGSNRFVVVMVASLHWQKDQDTIIRAMSHLTKEEYEAWIVGDGNRRNELESLTRQCKVENQVVFWGNRYDIPEILHTADVAIMSSHFEGLSLSSIEGMSIGHPFIASNVDGLRETVIDAGILFEHGNDKELASVIQRLQEDKTYYKEIADKCLERAKAYDISQTIKSYDSIYREVYAG